MPKITILVGSPGSGKSTLSADLIRKYGDANIITSVYINQDTQGKEHLNIFQSAIKHKLDIIVDRMNFDKKQRERYLNPTKEAGYETEIIVLHQNLETCLKRCNARDDHPTIRTEQDARKALDFFFSHYERPKLDEADKVNYVYPEITSQAEVIWIDADGTLCNTDHRQKYMEGPKKDWKSFFDNMDKDPVNIWCKKIINTMRPNNIIVICSGRPDNFKAVTKKWLNDNNIFYDELFMRPRSDSRKDSIVKEIIMDFELLTRYKSILFCVDDRKQVVDMLRSRGQTVLQCAEGLF